MGQLSSNDSKHMNHPEPYSERLEDRFWGDSRLIVLWILVLGLILRFVIWPIRDIALVCWVYGRQAYFHGGIHVLHGKPTRFSDGALCPDFPDIVTGLGAFAVTYVGLTTLLILGLRIFDRYFRQRGYRAA